MRNIVSEATHGERGVDRYWKDLKEVARINRNNPTIAEEKIWREMLKNKLTGYTFLRQKPIHRFIADFYCSELSMIIEIDGDSHGLKKDRDKIRDKFLECIGIKTIRFTNDDVLSNINKVKEVSKVYLVKGRLRGIEKVK